VDELGHGPRGAALTLGIVRLGQALQLATVAEGIEHDSQRAELCDSGCELGQGYHFAKPMEHGDVDKLLRPAVPTLPAVAAA